MSKIVEKIRETVVTAGTTFQPDKKRIFEKVIASEENERAKWVLEKILENALVAEKEGKPLCDDTGIPHIFIEIGRNRSISGKLLEDIYHGVREGLKLLPGRPMAIQGNDIERINQSKGFSNDPGDVVPAPFSIKYVDDDELLRVHVMLFGGGPAIRGKTQAIFHAHDENVVIDEIVKWATEGVTKLGCAPSTLAIGIGRSQFEATSLMLEAQIYADHTVQSPIEKEITDKVNKSQVGPLGLGGLNSVLATFVKVGPQRASGVRVVCLRPNCSIEPRIASVEL